MTTNKTKPRTVVGGVVIHHRQSANLDEIYAEQERLYIERDRLRAENAELRSLLADAQNLRPRLLVHLGYVPESVLDFCNRVRAALAKVKT